MFDFHGAVNKGSGNCICFSKRSSSENVLPRLIAYVPAILSKTIHYDLFYLFIRHDCAQ